MKRTSLSVYQIIRCALYKYVEFVDKYVLVIVLKIHFGFRNHIRSRRVNFDYIDQN